MAEFLINHHLGDRWQAFSAGVEPSSPNRYAIGVLKELGISADMARSKSVAEFLQRDDLDLVITVCDHAKENCPVFPKPIPQIHIGIDDPALYSDKPDDIVISIFRQTVNLINEKIILYLSESKNLFGDKK